MHWFLFYVSQTLLFKNNIKQFDIQRIVHRNIFL